jgi:hypothetical protein
MTLRERYIVGLKAMGYKEAPTSSKKYVVLGDAERGFYFLGKSGAVRYSHTNAVSGSVPVFESTKRRILAKVMPPSA